MQKKSKKRQIKDEDDSKDEVPEEEESLDSEEEELLAMIKKDTVNKNVWKDVLEKINTKESNRARFVECVMATFTCAICLSVPVRPVILPCVCKYNACEDCVTRGHESCGGKCSICKKSINLEDIKLNAPLWNIFLEIIPAYSVHKTEKPKNIPKKPVEKSEKSRKKEKKPQQPPITTPKRVRKKAESDAEESGRNNSEKEAEILSEESIEKTDEQPRKRTVRKSTAAQTKQTKLRATEKRKNATEDSHDEEEDSEFDNETTPKKAKIPKKDAMEIDDEDLDFQSRKKKLR